MFHELAMKKQMFFNKKRAPQNRPWGSFCNPPGLRGGSGQVLGPSSTQNAPTKTNKQKEAYIIGFLTVCLPALTAALAAAAVWGGLATTTTLAAAAVATAATTASATCDGEVGALVLALAVIPLSIVGHLFTAAAALKTWIVLNVDEDVVTALIWRDETEALVLEELLQRAGRSHDELAELQSETILRIYTGAGEHSAEPIMLRRRRSSDSQ
jgi:hypothetical protein